MSHARVDRGLYPLADPLPAGLSPGRYMAELEGSKRVPRQGEWFLSGAIIEAYQAGKGMTAPYHIARLVKVETITRRVCLA